jgi:hypothetical protein
MAKLSYLAPVPGRPGTGEADNSVSGKPRIPVIAGHRP